MPIPDSIPPSGPMSQRAYGKRRGVSHVAVQRAINSGRLRESVRDGKIIDPDLADQEWTANSDYTDAPQRLAAQSPEPAQTSESASAGTTLNEANRIEKIWKAKAAELNYRQEAKELVPAHDVERRMVEVFSACKTRLLGLPSRVRQALPHLSVADVAVVEELVRESLEELSR